MWEVVVTGTARGYSEPLTVEEMFERVKSIEVTGVELVGTWHISSSNKNQIKTLLKEHGLQLVSIIPITLVRQNGKWSFFK